MTACTCGCAAPHVVGRGALLSGEVVELWSSGVMADARGELVDGSPRSARSAEAHHRNMRAGWLALGELPLFEASELAELIAAARWVARRGGSPGDVRARFFQVRQRALRPTPCWTELSVDARGQVTRRVWQPSRMSAWSGYAVWNERGAYVLASITWDGVLLGDGFAFRRLGDLLDHMADPENCPGPATVRALDRGPAA